MSLDRRSQPTVTGGGGAGTDEEPAGLSTGGPSIRAWTIALAGPLLWFAHFGAVYVLAEWACTFGLLEQVWLGLPVLSILIVALTVLAAGATALTTGMAWRAWRTSAEAGADDGRSGRGPYDRRGVGPVAQRDHALDFIGLLLAPLFTLAILGVGLPALVLAPC